MYSTELFFKSEKERIGVRIVKLTGKVLLHFTERT